MTLQSMQPKVKRWQPVYTALLKKGVITTEEIRQIAGIGCVADHYGSHLSVPAL